MSKSIAIQYSNAIPCSGLQKSEVVESLIKSQEYDNERSSAEIKLEWVGEMCLV